jgi:hypothetical protein
MLNFLYVAQMGGFSYSQLAERSCSYRREMI